MLSKLFFSWLSAVILMTSTAAVAQSASELLEKGIYTEETVGDLDAAIEIYQKILANAAANRPFAARAQYRLGQCLLKQGKKKEATEAFRKLIKDFSDQKELVAKAKKHVPDEPEIKLEPVPWVDGESLQLVMKLQTGVTFGTLIYTAAKDEVDRRKIWRVGSRLYVSLNNANGLSWVEVDRDTFRPIRSRYMNNLMGDTRGEYTPTRVTVNAEKAGKKSSREDKLDKVVYDNEQGMHVFRRLPLAVGYKTTVPIYATFGGGKIGIPIDVTAKESVKVPAGEFECFKLELGLVNQTFWISADAHRYLVKVTAGGITMELASIRQQKPGQPSEYRDEEEGFSMAAPAGWHFFRHGSLTNESVTSVQILDPDAATTCLLRIWKLEDLDKEETASVGAWTESRVAKAREAWKGFQVRADSRHEHKIAGRPAESLVADYVDGEKKMVACKTYVLGKSTAMSFTLRAKPEQFDAIRKEFDKIVASYQTK